MLVKDITQAIEAVAPPVYQESYDNCGLQVGDPSAPVTGVLITLDVTEPLIDEGFGNIEGYEHAGNRGRRIAHLQAAVIITLLVNGRGDGFDSLGNIFYEHMRVLYCGLKIRKWPDAG